MELTTILVLIRAVAEAAKAAPEIMALIKRAERGETVSQEELEKGAEAQREALARLERLG